MKLNIRGEKEIEKIGEDAFGGDTLLRHYVENRGQWELIAPFVSKAQAKETAKQVFGWGNKECRHKDGLTNKGCAVCWGELEGEVKNED